MNEDIAVLLNEVRYAERLCQRTARLYRRVQAIGVFFTVVGGSAALTALSAKFPPEVSVAGALAFAIFGAALLTIRPADKASANEADAKRYAKLRADANGMTEAALRSALDKARESDTAEVEPLRDVAFNDVVNEIGQASQSVRLTMTQRILSSLA